MNLLRQVGSYVRVVPPALAASGHRHRQLRPISGRLSGLCVALAAVAVMLAGSWARACDTPVFRYAMYNWATSPYWVFYLHRGPEAEEDQKVNSLLDQLGSAEEGAVANILVERMDVSDEKTLERVPGAVKEAWKSYQDGATPVHIVMTPRGGKLFAGRLDEATVRAMVDSPARTRLGELLGEGNTAVMLLLPGSKEEENKKAEEALQELTTRVAGGEITMVSDFEDPALIGVPPPETTEEGAQGDPATAEPQEKPGGLKVAVLKVDRSDKAEAWFIRTLMAIEPDLGEYAEEPMIFAGYGRGRAMEPYIGKGITGDNLLDVVAFLAGACSCQVKEQNPGADLLIRWDWEKTADLVAADDPAFDDGPMFYQEFPAEVTAQADTEMTEADKTNQADADAADADAAETISAPEADAEQVAGTEVEPTAKQPAPEAVAMIVDPPVESPSQETSAAKEVPEAAGDEPPATLQDHAALAGGHSAPGDAGDDHAGGDSAPVDLPPAMQSSQAPESFADRQTSRLGLGLVIAAVCLIVVSIVVVLRRS